MDIQHIMRKKNKKKKINESADSANFSQKNANRKV